MNAPISDYQTRSRVCRVGVSRKGRHSNTPLFRSHHDGFIVVSLREPNENVQPGGDPFDRQVGEVSAQGSLVS